MIFTTPHPGSWQDFMRKPENSKLSIQEATRKYKEQLLLFEQQYSTFIQQQQLLQSQNFSGGTKAQPDTSLDKYVFSLDPNNIDSSVTGSSAPNSTIVVTDVNTADSFRFTPDDFDFPNANEIIIEDDTMWIGYNFVFNVANEELDNAYKLVRLENVKINFNSNSISYDIAENILVKSGSEQLRQGHGFDKGDGYLYIGSRGSDGAGNYTRGMRIAKINEFDFSDIEVFHYPADSDTASADYLSYYDGYIYVQSNGGYSTNKITKINANDLSDYVTYTDTVTGLIGIAGVCEIYKGTIITTAGYTAAGVRLLQYSLDGVLLRNELIQPTTAGTKAYNLIIPHSSIIIDNYMYISNTYAYTDFMKIDLDTFTLEGESRISTTLNAQITDDAAVGIDGNIYYGVERTTFISEGQQVSTRLVKVDPSDMSITTITPMVSSSYAVGSIKAQELRNLAKLP